MASSLERTMSEEEEEKEKEKEKEKEEEKEKERGCRPLGFLIGLPFVLVAVLFSLLGGIIWILGTILRYVCPCCGCIAGLANSAVTLINLPIRVIRWFIYRIPC